MNKWNLKNNNIYMNIPKNELLRNRSNKICTRSI